MKFVFGFLIGAIMGTVMALLFAPSSGDQLRKNIKTQADTQVARLQVEWQKGMEEMQTRMDKMSSDLQSITSGSEGSNQA